MLYHTYRPKRVEDIDNARVREIIKNYLQSPTPPHAWLFTGHKGMGKTSVARILACELNKSGDVEKDTRMSADIEVGTSPDIQEINGADNTGIDDVRALIANIQYAPMTCKYRMYIIDEVHMLSTSAFNGLLKILEEPPAHAIFILATTALDKIPATIQSRCVRVDFGTAAVEDVKRMIQRICAHEKITLDPEVMSLIATHCDRSFRDATKILEELILQKALTLTDAQKYLGTRAKDTLLVQLLAQDANNAITWSYQYASEGGDMKLLIEDTLRQIHALLLQTYGIEPDIMPPVVSFTRPQLVKLLRVFHDAYVLVRVSPIPQSAVQIAIMEYYKP